MAGSTERSFIMERPLTATERGTVRAYYLLFDYQHHVQMYIFALVIFTYVYNVLPLCNDTEENRLNSRSVEY